MSEQRPRFQFYGRRKGHALRRHHLQLIETLLPKLRVDLKNSLSAAATEIWLEIGFGGGEHLAHQASLHQEIHFIGAEFFINGVAKLLALIEEKQLSNVRIFDGDARNLLEVLPAALLMRVYLLYPDPWPKARHKKRRFVNAENLNHIHRLLKPGGLFIFASDIPDYVSWTQELMAAQGGFGLCALEVNRPPEDWVGTRYEAKAKVEGRIPTYLRYRRL